MSYRYGNSGNFEYWLTRNIANRTGLCTLGCFNFLTVQVYFAIFQRHGVNCENGQSIC